MGKDTKRVGFGYLVIYYSLKLGALPGLNVVISGLWIMWSIKANARKTDKTKQEKRQRKKAKSRKTKVTFKKRSHNNVISNEGVGNCYEMLALSQLLINFLKSSK